MPVATTPPGVTVREIFSPSTNAFVAPQGDLCIVGLAGSLGGPTYNPIQTTDTMILSGTSPQLLPTLASLNSDAVLVEVLSVQDVLNPSIGNPPGTGYVAGNDYTVQAGEGPPDGTNGTITRLNSGAIANGTLVQVTYTYAPSDYWQPVRMFDIGSVEARFGASWQTATSSVTGETYNVGINSQLSMGARMAFANGAQSVICQPLFARSTPGDPSTTQQAPTASQVGSTSTWNDTLYVLRPIGNIGMLVPVVGQDNNHVHDADMLNVFGAVQAFQHYMNGLQQYVIAIFGEDGTIEGTGSVGTNGTATGLVNTLRNVHAPYLQSSFNNALSSQCVLANNTVFQLPVPGLNTTINVGGQFAAAAVGGALAARAPSQGLTRQPILGFQSITDPRTTADKNMDASSGLMVIEQVVSGGSGVIRVRQGNTLDITEGYSRSELSVVRAKFAMMESIQETLDSQIIGNIIADSNSPIIVRSTIGAVLSLLQQQGVIVGYNNVTASLTTLNPTTIVASFSYQPAFPLNFIDVTFTLDLSAGTVTGNAP